ncbi:hypothetical protein H5410_009834 [Solanum commersonii]|uniref:Uncharacterized protein n=1 Tax=Solanum commersonii TaxID=4109 RepID=A0A9J6AJ14_SOLCO|nr:hypothetical protein H5410_009834 [Solanum commersonii]
MPLHWSAGKLLIMSESPGSIILYSNRCQHSIVLYLRLPDRRTVVGNDTKFCFGASNSLENSFVKERVYVISPAKVATTPAMASPVDVGREQRK